VTPQLFDAFDTLCRRYGASGHALEIGATLSDDTLLNLGALRACESRIGINLEHAGRVAGGDVLQGNANDLRRFADDAFDVVLSNATLEHDRFFWLTLAEMRRVLKPGGLLVIGVPGYVRTRSFARRVAGRLGNWSRAFPLLATPLHAAAAATPTLHVHDHPGDYYRFSAQAMREVLLAGTDVLAIEVLAAPPRLVGAGRKRNARETP